MTTKCKYCSVKIDKRPVPGGNTCFKCKQRHLNSYGRNRYHMLKNTVGLTREQWNAILDKYVLTNTMLASEGESLGLEKIYSQYDLIHELRKSFTRIKMRSERKEKKNLHHSLINQNYGK